MIVLGIESSCDETAAAVVEDGHIVHSNVVASQDELHIEYGGVVPEIASRAHVERMLPVVEQAIQQANISPSDLDGIAVGNRPGLIGALLVGVTAAKSIAWSLDVPFVAVDHVLAHLYAPNLGDAHIEYPALGLVVSGGHTSILNLSSPIEATCVCKTVDDAAGEAFDKAASILELGWPGGPLIEEAAQGGNDVHKLPRPKKKNEETFYYSFSGLKTALLYGVKGIPKRIDGVLTYERQANDLTAQEQSDWAASFQTAAVESILMGVEIAFEQGNYKSLVAGGGVTANKVLRQALQVFANENDTPLHIPKFDYCVDNGAMIAGLGTAFLRQNLTNTLATTASPKGIAS